LIRTRGLYMGREHVGKGVNIALGPMMNLVCTAIFHIYSSRFLIQYSHRAESQKGAGTGKASERIRFWLEKVSGLYFIAGL